MIPTETLQGCVVMVRRDGVPRLFFVQHVDRFPGLRAVVEVRKNGIWYEPSGKRADYDGEETDAIKIAQAYMDAETAGAI